MMPLEQRPESTPQKYPQLVELLARELGNPTVSGPRIIEEKLRGLPRIHVTVIWDKWSDVDPSDRAEVILDAYRSARGEPEMLRISLALGLTPEEASRLKVA